MLTLPLNAHRNDANALLLILREVFLATSLLKIISIFLDRFYEGKEILFVILVSTIFIMMRC